MPVYARAQQKYLAVTGGQNDCAFGESGHIAARYPAMLSRNAACPYRTAGHALRSVLLIILPINDGQSPV